MIALLAALGFAGAAVGAWAQDGHHDSHHGVGHVENHDWYRGLKQPFSGASCCNVSKDGVEGDCRPTRAYLGDDGQWRALLDGRWVPVPPRVVLDSRLNKDAIRSHICAGKSGIIYCFIGGGDGA
ncbi:MAG: hypothetical protein HYZ40_16065 [Rhodospirillales bacterium]|nr:hypothetical protein [Rhodospirillales bacterium]